MPKKKQADTNSKKIAIYTRKSKYSDKSESIDSQIEYCKKAAVMRYPDIDEFVVFVDEGFSGGDTARPQYQKMLLEIKDSRDFAAVICYKIDRISRSLADFTNLQQTLEKSGVHIISASEGFDTSSTWGVAVLNILMIFAQMERSHTSERIRDTMLHYARQGRWTGGLTPTGFESKSIPYSDAFGHEKNMVILAPIEEELRTVKIIYDKYLEKQSLAAVETYLAQNDIKSKKGSLYTVATVRALIINPVYAVADKELYDFFVEKGSEICHPESDFDGSCSVIPYNRENKAKTSKRPHDEWIIAISRHKGIIEGKDWVKAQRILAENSMQLPRLGTADFGIFSGLMKCADCGSTMRVKAGRQIANSDVKGFYYVCHLKEISRGQKCKMKNLSGHEIEPAILEQLLEYTKDAEMMEDLARRNNIRFGENLDEKKKTFEHLKGQLAAKETAIKNLVTQVSQTDNLATGKILMDQIGELDKAASDLRHRVALIEVELSSEKARELDLLSLSTQFANLSQVDSLKSVKDKRLLMKGIIDRMEWDGRAMSISFKSGDKMGLNAAHSKGSLTLEELQTFDN